MNKMINEVDVTVNGLNQVTRLEHHGEVVDLTNQETVVVSLDGDRLTLKNTYNEAQRLCIVVDRTALLGVKTYINDPVTAYRTVVQIAAHDAMQTVRNMFSSFVMYGSQGLDTDTVKRLSLTYRVIGSLHDMSIVSKVVENEHKEVPRLTARGELSKLIIRLLELHFGFVTKPSDDVDLLEAPIDSIISGRAPDTLVHWALESGLITQHQAERSLSV